MRKLINDTAYLSLVTRMPIFGVSDQFGHKPVCSASVDYDMLDISDIKPSNNIIQTANTSGVNQTVRMRRWFAPLLFE